ncbi:hypothetical protein QBC35DRAFT_554401 [Podospora australis]|uniref:Uncharacterized protein n=1 Tax=Podospora australis TaxID=1536484 RepID=A0AAN6WRD2_9PEZI|nr:hypothetical protein QBC35DRAFT_554401 [Podospora australis]
MDFTNKHQRHYFFLYETGRETPWKYTELEPGNEIFISVCSTFAGHVVRGNPTENLDGKVRHNLGTVVELAWERQANGTNRSWGYISLLEGCDGGAVLTSTDGSGVTTGFSKNILVGAPFKALSNKTDGSVVLDRTVEPGANVAALKYELCLLDPLREAFIIQTFRPVVVTENGRWDLTFYPGTY